jgi:hypothetical protein
VAILLDLSLGSTEGSARRIYLASKVTTTTSGASPNTGARAKLRGDAEVSEQAAAHALIISKIGSLSLRTRHIGLINISSCS